MYDTCNILHLYCIFTVHLTLLRLVILYVTMPISIICKYVKVSHRFSLRLVYVPEPVHSVPTSSMGYGGEKMLFHKLLIFAAGLGMQFSENGGIYPSAQRLKNSCYHVQLGNTLHEDMIFLVGNFLIFFLPLLVMNCILVVC